MKTAGKMFLSLLMFCVVLTVCAFASGEPSGEPSGEKIDLASGEPSGEIASDEAFGGCFGVTIRIGCEALESLAVSASAEGNVYTFNISELLSALGVELSYDEESGVAVIEGTPGGVMSMLLAQCAPAEEAQSAEAPEPAAPSAAGGRGDVPSGAPMGQPAGEAPVGASVPEGRSGVRVLPDRQTVTAMKKSANLDRALLSLPSKDPT